MGILRHRPRFFCLLIFILFIGNARAQSKRELQQQVVELNKQLKELRASQAQLTDSLTSLINTLKSKSEQVERLENAIDALNGDLSPAPKYPIAETTSDTIVLETVNAAIKTYKKRLFSKESEADRSKQYQIFEEQSLSACLAFEAYQTLFMETSILEYQLLADTNIFVGLFKNQYLPEFGPAEYHVQRLQGVYLKKGESIVLIITSVENADCEIQIIHNTEDPSISEVVAARLDLMNLYKREVSISEMSPSDCP